MEKNIIFERVHSLFKRITKSCAGGLNFFTESLPWEIGESGKNLDGTKVFQFFQNNPRPTCDSFEKEFGSL